MSAYQDFVSDFPARCLDVLTMAEKEARLRQRDVTLILMVASAGFVVPYERLSSKKAHPTGDSAKFSEASAQLDALMKRPFLKSPLAVGTESWHGGKLAAIARDPDSWPELSRAKPLGADKTVGGVVRIIRNALAHGNIFTYSNPIKGIVFVCANTDDDRYIKDFSFVQVSPEDFTRFLRGWFGFLKTSQVSQKKAQVAIANAA
jgi:hypothetical protein